MKVVIDINVLISAFWSRDGVPSQIMALLLNEKIIPCYDNRIIQEYEEVLLRPKFSFSFSEVKAVLNWLKLIGVVVVAPYCTRKFTDEADKKFYEVAKAADALLITGNKRHFPKDNSVISPKEFMDLFYDVAK